jgi:uncharacterized protein YciI
MAYVIVGRDAAGSAGPRQEHLARHLEFVERSIDRILVAGPLRDRASGANVGSLYVLDVDSEADARALLESDPYYAAGVWASVTVEPFMGAAGKWVGGLAWKNARR